MNRRERRILREKLEKKKRKKKIKLIGFLLLIVIIISVGVGFKYIKHTLSKISVDNIPAEKGKDNEEVKQIDDDKQNELEIGESRYKPLTDKERLYKYDSVKDDQRYVNILILGVDGRHGEAMQYATNSDTMMLASYDTTAEIMNIISIPRDTKVAIDTSIPKINSAFPSGGAEKAMKVVGNLFDTKVDYYVKVNYSGFRAFIDKIGGVDVEITTDMHYEDESQDLYINFNAGETVWLDGKRAEEFVRWRQNNDGSGDGKGDMGRIERQHMFINKVINKLKSPAIVTKLKGIIDIIPKCIETNMSVDEIIDYAWDFATLGRENIKMLTLQGEYDYIYTPSQGKDICYYLINKNKITDILNLFHSKDYIDKTHMRVEVDNCTDKKGLAADFGKFIRTEGYENIELLDGEKREETKMVFYGVDEETIAILKQEFRIDNVEINPYKSEHYDVKVLLGKDHDYIYIR
jgi:LCP family protein required for cell wall assembly